MKQIHPQALFRLSVLGPLASRDRLEQGELKRLLRELSVIFHEHSATLFSRPFHQARRSELLFPYIT